MNLSVNEAAAPSSLAFMLWGCGIVVFPLMLLYTIISLGCCDLQKPVV
jgi:cytochrome bd ubiquinol oxidase subunit II